MKRFRISILLLTILFVQLGSAQTTKWVRQSGGDGRPNDLHFVTKDKGWVVGQTGTILTTNNAGINWVKQNSETTRNLNNVFFLDENKGYVVGNSGHILRTLNGGVDWTEQTGQTSENLTGVFFIDDSKGWIVGSFGAYQYTTNGGETWEKSNPFSNTTMTSVFFIDANNGWAGGSTPTSTNLYHTTDGGLTWNLQKQVVRGGGNSTVRVQFVNGTHGWFSDSDELFYTTNGGADWTAYAKNQQMPSGQCFHFLSPTKGYSLSGVYLVSNFGSTSDGVNFTKKGELEGFYRALQFVDENHGFAIGETFIQRTKDGGDTWETVGAGTYGINLTGIDFLNDQFGFSVGSVGMILKTENGGLEWLGQSKFTNDNLKGVQIVDAQNIIVWSTRKLWHSGDGGSSWTQKHEFPADRNSIYFVNPSKGYAVGDGGKPHITTDGGQTWTAQTTTNYTTLNSVFFIDENKGWAAGGTRVLYTIDGGGSWTPSSLGLQVTASDVKFYNDSVGYVAARQAIFRSTDGGVTWEKVFNRDFGNYFQTTLALLDDNTIVSSGEKTVISTDRGQTWTQVSAPQLGGTILSGNAITNVGDNRIWIVGYNATIYHMTDDLAYSFNEVAKNDVKLYPNPASNKVTIESNLPLGNNASIELFDLNGKRIQMEKDNLIAVNDYTIQLNLHDMNPGIYFVRIHLDGHIITEKIQKY